MSLSEQFKHSATCVGATVGATLAMAWFAGSLGTPLISSLYVGYLGETVDLKFQTTYKIVGKNENEEIPHPDAYFIKQLKASSDFPLLMVLGPLSIPISALYCASSTLGYACYRIKMCKDKNEE